MKNILLISFLILSNLTFGQDTLLGDSIQEVDISHYDSLILKENKLPSVYIEKYNPLAPPNTYQNADNPNYWKNKMPNKGYWQQDVYYNIKANIDEETDIINATQKLTYWNNSPDKLDFVFF